MRLEHAKTAIVSIFVLLALLVCAGPLVADGEKSEKEADKTEETAKKAESKGPVSPIYKAAQEAPDQKQKDEEAVVITNDDLERMMSGLTPEQRLQGVYQAERHIGVPAPAAAGESEKKPQSSLEWLEQRNEAAKEQRVEHVDAEKQVAELSAKVSDLERRLLALKNPLLPRRYADKKDPEAEDWDQMDNIARVETTQKELDDARAELAAAQAKLGRGRSR